MAIVSYNVFTTIVKLVFKIHREKARKWSSEGMRLNLVKHC